MFSVFTYEFDVAKRERRRKTLPPRGRVSLAYSAQKIHCSVPIGAKHTPAIWRADVSPAGRAEVRWPIVPASQTGAVDRPAPDYSRRSLNFDCNLTYYRYEDPYSLKITAERERSRKNIPLVGRPFPFDHITGHVFPGLDPVLRNKHQNYSHVLFNIPPYLPLGPHRAHGFIKLNSRQIEWIKMMQFCCHTTID